MKLSKIFPIITLTTTSLIPFVVTACNSKIPTVDINVEEKEKITGQKCLSLFEMTTEAQIEKTNVLKASVVEFSGTKGIEPLVVGVSKPQSSVNKFYTTMKIQSSAGHVTQTGESITFKLKFECVDKDGKILWQSFVDNLSMSYTQESKEEDTDYDGLTNDIDPEPTNNNYKGIMDSWSMQPLDFKIDYRKLLDGDASEYSEDLAKLGSILSTDAYSPNNIIIDDQWFIGEDRFSKLMGCDDWESFDLKAMEFQTDKNDTTFFTVSHHDMHYQSPTNSETELYKIVFISFEGTSGNPEWLSDFDVGMDDEKYYEKVKPEGGTGTKQDHPDWEVDTGKNALHTKGVCVAANRTIKLLEGEQGYFKRHSIDLANDNVILFINGHSRGAAITNLLAARYIDLKESNSSYAGLKKIFGYCFASPFVTFDNQAKNSKYDSIHCIVNDDDIVGKIPFESWGLYKYGQEHISSISKKHKEDFEQKWKECDQQDHKYYYFNHFLDYIDWLPVKKRNDLYNINPLDEGFNSKQKIIVNSIPYDSQTEAEYDIAIYKDTLKILHAEQYFSFSVIPLNEDYERYNIECINCGGGLVAIAGLFFLDKPVPIEQLVAIIPLLSNYLFYALNLVERFREAIVESGNEDFLTDFGNCCHSCPTYYYACQNIDTNVKNR